MPFSKKQRWGLGLGAGALIAAGLVTGSVIHQARETAQAYLFGYPLVIMELTKQHQMLVGTSAINGLNHRQRFPDASFNSVVSPNVDTLYTLSHFDLRHEPLVMSIPSTAGHFYMMQIMDAWTNVVVSPGTRTIGTGPKTYLLAGPTWQGQVPSGMELVRVPTELAWMIGRIKSSGPQDYAEVGALQQQFRLMPLSAWQGHPGAPAPVEMATLPRLERELPPDRQLANWSQDEFFSTFCRLLPNNPPRAEDAPMMARIKATGLLGDDCQPQLSPLQRLGSAIGYEKVVATLNDSKELLEKLTTYNGWRIGYDLGEYATRYDQRALVAKIGLGANLAADAIYPNLWKDQDGQPLNGNHRYVLHFAKGQLPPVRAFWSLTLYNARQFLADNPLDRYALGDRDDLHYNADGSLDLYIQREQPSEQERSSNWLPAPDGDFSLFLRLYWPEQAVLDKHWLPPIIQRLP
ncbi:MULTISPECIES: DUF1254 domain-containing protein [unclassified Pseudomonas]|uniref:DUF1254 domain-containing protein n=1 Tax=unclassified Pseudomonas TaxID=196821 RepID=UPI002446DBC8|nr:MULTISPECIES: DUF1254 domain-containing protein [unclassified Pseudomonas]MDG9925116.1 DUF1254 domain-containing protein [Pseudomonas sp. GD04045]MDH0037009.1 DUF1254 domain-containing protein [Pseudomonas sp. GD04019]